MCDPSLQYAEAGSVWVLLCQTLVVAPISDTLSDGSLRDCDKGSSGSVSLDALGEAEQKRKKTSDLAIGNDKIVETSGGRSC